MKSEKRKQQRYLVKGRAIAIVSPNNILPYEILDISQSGLAFSYRGLEQWENDLLELELIYDQECCIDKVPIKIISDSPLDDSSRALRRCGVQFGELTPNQQSQLEYFIQEHTIGIA